MATVSDKVTEYIALMEDRMHHLEKRVDELENRARLYLVPGSDFRRFSDLTCFDFDLKTFPENLSERHLAVTMCEFPFSVSVLTGRDSREKFVIGDVDVVKRVTVKDFINGVIAFRDRMITGTGKDPFKHYLIGYDGLSPVYKKEPYYSLHGSDCYS